MKDLNTDTGYLHDDDAGMISSGGAKDRVVSRVDGFSVIGE